MKSNITIFKRGDVVQSMYRAPWHGIVLGVNCWSTYKGVKYAVLDVLALESADGRKHRKPTIHVLSYRWLTPSSRKLTIPDNYS